MHETVTVQSTHVSVHGDIVLDEPLTSDIPGASVLMKSLPRRAVRDSRGVGLDVVLTPLAWLEGTGTVHSSASCYTRPVVVEVLVGHAGNA